MEAAAVAVIVALGSRENPEDLHGIVLLDNVDDAHANGATVVSGAHNGSRRMRLAALHVAEQRELVPGLNGESAEFNPQRDLVLFVDLCAFNHDLVDNASHRGDIVDALLVLVELVNVYLMRSYIGFPRAEDVIVSGDNRFVCHCDI